MIPEFKGVETVVGVREGFVERQSTGLILGKQRIRIGNQDESVPSRPRMPSMVWYRMNRFSDMFEDNPHAITRHDPKKWIFFRDEEICLETEFLIVEVD